MGLTVSDVTTATSTTSSGTLEITGVSASVGDMLVVMLACDNTGANGTPPTVTCTDSGGNTYTSRVNNWRSATSVPNDGVANRAFTSSITTALSGGTITLSLDPNTTAKTALVKKIAPDAGEEVTYGTNAGNSSTSTLPTVTTSSITNGHTVIGFVGIETNENIFSDSDTTNGTWSTQQTELSNTGTVFGSVRIASQHKTVTATATQTYNPTTANTRDWAINWMSFSATALPLSGALLSNSRNRLVIV